MKTFIYDDIKITVRKRYNKWYLDFTYNDKRVRRSTSLDATDKNLIVIKNEIVPEIITALTGNKEIEFFKKDLTIDEFSVKYFQVYKNTVRAHVYKRNMVNYNKHVKPYFGTKLLNDILPLELEEWQNKLLSKYKINTVSKYRSVFYSILDKALINDLIKVNPFSKVKSPKSINIKLKKLNDKSDEDVDPFNNEEVLKILDNAHGNLYQTIVLMLYTGMRPGEVISLHWNDFDFEKKRIAVEKTIVNGVVGDVKTQSSVRYVDIIPSLEKILLEFKENSNSQLYITNSSNKQFYSHDILNLRFKELLEKINIKVRTLYNLRHTFASTMITDGINILWVSKMLGHKDVSITLKIYAKFIKEDDSLRLENLRKIVPYFVPL